MISPASFTSRKILASAFLSGEDLFPRSILKLVLRDWEAIYDGSTVVLPVGPELPEEFPVVMLSSQDKTLTLEASRARINLTWAGQSDVEIPNIGATLAAFADRLATISEELNLRVSRLGSVVVRSTKQPYPGKTLAHLFCRDKWLTEPLNRPEGFELHANKVFLLFPNLQVNSWMRIKTAKVGGPDYEYVVVEQDINTLAEEQKERRFARNEMISWFQAASMEFERILGLYFPTH